MGHETHSSRKPGCRPQDGDDSGTHGALISRRLYRPVFTVCSEQVTQGSTAVPVLLGEEEVVLQGAVPEHQ